MKNYLVILLIALTLSLQWYSHGNRLLLTPDSKHYITGSESFRKSFSFIDNNGHSYLFWPPLFPIIISIFRSPENELIWLNGILTICISVVTLSILTRLIKHEEIRFLSLVFILLGVHLLLISSFLWSELIFLVFTLVFVDQLQKSKEIKTSFYLAIVSGFLMCLRRNAGMFIAVGASIWIFINEIGWLQKIMKSTFFFLP